MPPVSPPKNQQAFPFPLSNLPQDMLQTVVSKMSPKTKRRFAATSKNTIAKYGVNRAPELNAAFLHLITQTKRRQNNIYSDITVFMPYEHIAPFINTHRNLDFREIDYTSFHDGIDRYYFTPLPTAPSAQRAQSAVKTAQSSQIAKSVKTRKNPRKTGVLFRQPTFEFYDWKRKVYRMDESNSAFHERHRQLSTIVDRELLPKPYDIEKDVMGFRKNKPRNADDYDHALKIRFGARASRNGVKWLITIDHLWRNKKTYVTVEEHIVMFNIWGQHLEDILTMNPNSQDYKTLLRQMKQFDEYDGHKRPEQFFEDLWETCALHAQSVRFQFAMEFMNGRESTAVSDMEKQRFKAFADMLRPTKRNNSSNHIIAVTARSPK